MWFSPYTLCIIQIIVLCLYNVTPCLVNQCVRPHVKLSGYVVTCSSPLKVYSERCIVIVLCSCSQGIMCGCCALHVLWYRVWMESLQFVCSSWVIVACLLLVARFQVVNKSSHTPLSLSIVYLLLRLSSVVECVVTHSTDVFVGMSSPREWAVCEGVVRSARHPSSPASSTQSVSECVSHSIWRCQGLQLNSAEKMPGHSKKTPGLC